MGVRQQTRQQLALAWTEVGEALPLLGDGGTTIEALVLLGAGCVLVVFEQIVQ